MENYNEIIDAINNAKNDETLFSNINIDELFSQINKNTFDAIIHKKIIDINNDIYSFFKNKSYSDEKINEYCHRLLGYRMVNELYELHKGKPVKIFNLKTGKLTMGGIVCNINILDNGINILCKNINMPGKFMQYKYNNHVTFQMLSEEEQLILLINEKILSI